MRLYTMGMNAEVVAADRWERFEVVSGDYDPSTGGSRPAVPANTDYAILRVRVSNAFSPERRFGGASPDELDMLSFSEMATARSWKIEPSLADIQAVMNEVGPGKTVLSIYFSQPFVLDADSGLLDAGAILATFGVADAAVMDVVTGRHAPSGKLPFALANSAAAIRRQAPDAPGYAETDTLFPFGHGLTY